MIHDGRLGRIKSGPDRDGDVKLEWADGSGESEYLKAEELTRVTERDFLVRHAPGGPRWPHTMVYLVA